MAKKKTASGGPTRECENCHERYHPRKKECPHCGAANPAMAGGGRPKKKVAKGRTAAAAPAAAAAPRATPAEKTQAQQLLLSHSVVSAVEAAGEFIEAAGGIVGAKAILEQIERVQNR